jgi:SAM-dependent methyltransferase
MENSLVHEPPTTPFDAFASNYDAALQEGLAVSGENKEYFARGRVNFLKGCLAKFPMQPGSVLDYGCGTGTSVPLLGAMPGVKSVLGTDLSEESIVLARKTHTQAGQSFVQLDRLVEENTFELAFCNGVFHHIPPPERLAAATRIWRALKPGGVFAFWENNPWNPATRYVMSRIPFDKDAITLTPPEARHLLRNAGFGILRTDYLFIFPRLLKWLRPIEQVVSGWPLGTQYQVLCRKEANQESS